MPLVLPSNLPKIYDLRSLKGKRVVDQALVPSDQQQNYPFDTTIFTAQLPSYVILIKQYVDRTAITGAVQSGYTPLIVDNNDVVIEAF
jgi:hypothetical protein